VPAANQWSGDPPPSTVAVVGLGLIGASLCGALRRRLPAARLIGVTRRPRTADRALADGICDVAGTDPRLLGEAEFVVLCTPVDAMPEWLSACAETAPRALVTDCGSTKAWVVDQAHQLLGPGRFLGGHPMAGREQSGYDAADANLFDDCVWVVCPQRRSDLQTFAPWLAVIALLGARLEVLEASQHDAATAWISHLPFTLSAALVRAAADAASWPDAARLAASGFRDMSRLAGGDPTMYAAIVATNSEKLAEALASYEEELRRFRRSLSDREAAHRYFAEAEQLRRRWLEVRVAMGHPIA